MQTYTVRYTTKKILSSDETKLTDAYMVVEAEDFPEAARKVVESIGTVYKLLIVKNEEAVA